MTLNLQPVTSGVSAISPPRITVIGVGGGGGNAVDNMIAESNYSSQSADLSSVEFIVANTDAQQLSISRAKKRLQLGPSSTRGLGAGAKPEVGRQAAEEVENEIKEHLKGVDLVFITAGMGGGTGTGAAPVIARIARELGALTIGVVSKPFKFEGIRRSRAAEEGISQLQQHVDTLIVIPNQNLFNCSNQNTTLEQAFKMADEVLHRGVRSITDTMVIPGKINLDFADVTTVMKEKGKAMIGTGHADASEGETGWALAAAERAISNPLLEENSIKGASGLLVNVTGGNDLGLHEYTEIMERIGQEAHPDAEIISGLLQSEEMNGKVQISVVATGLTPVSPEQDSHSHKSNHKSEKTHIPSFDKRTVDRTTLSTKIEPSDAEPTSPPSMAMHEEQTQPHAMNHNSNHNIPDYAQRVTPQQPLSPPSSSIPNYNLDPHPVPSQQHNTQQHNAPPSLSRQSQRPPYQEDAPQPSGGFFSNFFRRPPVQEPPQRPHNNSGQNQPNSGNHPSQQLYNPPSYYDDNRNEQNSDLDVPAYLRRNNPPS